MRSQVLSEEELLALSMKKALDAAPKSLFALNLEASTSCAPFQVPSKEKNTAVRPLWPPIHRTRHRFQASTDQDAGGCQQSRQWTASTMKDRLGDCDCARSFLISLRIVRGLGARGLGNQCTISLDIVRGKDHGERTHVRTCYGGSKDLHHENTSEKQTCSIIL